MSANLMSLAQSGGKFLKLYGDRKMMKPLPYDAEVEYLQGDGVARIMLDDRYSPEKKYIGIGITEESYTGRFAGAEQGRRAQYVGATSGRIEAKLSSPGDSFIVSVDGATPYKCYDYIADGVNISISLDGNVLSSKETTVKIPHVATTNKMELFAIRGTSSSTEIVGTWAGLCYYFKLVTVEGETVLDLIPVRKDGVGYMYDRVSGRLYGNAAGTGAFIIGPDKTI